MTLFDILSITKKEYIDIIHAHGYGAANFGRLAGMIVGSLQSSMLMMMIGIIPCIKNWQTACLEITPTRLSPCQSPVKESCINKRNISKDKTFVIHNGIHYRIL